MSVRVVSELGRVVGSERRRQRREQRRRNAKLVRLLEGPGIEITLVNTGQASAEFTASFFGTVPGSSTDTG